MTHDLLPLIGNPVPPEARGLRDAVHVAVFAAQSTRPLMRGMRVGFETEADGLSGGRTVVPTPHCHKVLGVVDPFLSASRIEPGTWFFVFLLPQTTTGLRHVWTHPAFPAQE